jgi:hypothetical protein
MSIDTTGLKRPEDKVAYNLRQMAQNNADCPSSGLFLQAAGMIERLAAVTADNRTLEAAFAAATAQGQRISRVLGTAHSRIAKLERELAAVNDNRYALAVLCQPSKVLVLPAAAEEVQSE